MPSIRVPSAFIPFLILAAACAAPRPRAASASGGATSAMAQSEALVIQVRQTGSGLGTGLVVATQGYVLTNHHVIEVKCEKDQATGASSCTSGRYEVCATVDFVSSCVPAELIAWDEKRDLALLKSSRAFAQAATFGDEMRLGPAETVYAWISVGLILPPSLFVGRYVNRVDPRFAPVNQSALVFDLSMNHGGSGGPIFNARGEVVALMTGFTNITNDPSGNDNGAPLAVAVPASEVAAFLKKHGLAPRFADAAE